MDARAGLCSAVLANASHGTHICAFYETKEDLLDLVTCFFAAHQNDLCVWVRPDSVSDDEAKSLVSKVAECGFEIYAAREFYLSTRRGRQFFHRDPAIRILTEKLQQAIAANCSVCASGDTFWLQQHEWNVFLDYESDVNAWVTGKPIALLCTYPFALSKVGDVFDVVRAHQFAIAKRNDEWEVLEAPMNPNRRAEAVDAGVRVASLTARERQVIDAIIYGRSNKVIAHELGVSIKAVERYRSRLLHRLGVRTMVEAVRLGTLAMLVSEQLPVV